MSLPGFRSRYSQTELENQISRGENAESSFERVPDQKYYTCITRDNRRVYIVYSREDNAEDVAQKAVVLERVLGRLADRSQQTLVPWESGAASIRPERRYAYLISFIYLYP